MASDYSVLKAPAQSTTPSCSSGLCRFSLVKRIAAFPANGKLGRRTNLYRCCHSVTHARSVSDKLSALGDSHMDVYLNTRRDLLVVKKGCPIPPIAALGSWRKSKKRVVKVSEEIRSAIQAHGYYMRKVRDVHHTSGGTSIAAASTNVQSLQHHN